MLTFVPCVEQIVEKSGRDKGSGVRSTRAHDEDDEEDEHDQKLKN